MQFFGFFYEIVAICIQHCYNTLIVSEKEKPMKRKDTIWNPVFTSVFIANVCAQMGQQMMNTLVPKFAHSLGAAASTVGFVSSVFAITALAIRPVSGPAADSFSKKKLLILSNICTVVAFLAYSMSTEVSMVVAARLLHGIGVGMSSPLCLAMASNSLPDSKLGSGVGVFSLGQAVSQAIGPTIGLSLSRAIGYSQTFLVGTAVMAAAIVCAFMIREMPEDRPKFRISLDRIIAKGAIRPSVVMFFLGASYSCLSSFLAIYGGARGVDQIGLFFTAYACTMLVTRPICGKLIDKLGFEKVLVPGIVFFACSFALVSMAKSLPGFILAGVVGACGYGVCQPTVQSLCMRCTPKNQRGAAGNTNYIGMDCGMLFGPTVSGFVVDSLMKSGVQAVDAYSKMYLIMTIPMMIGLAYFLLALKRIKKDIADLDAAQAASKIAE
ncbi:MAG: MFS transporter [Firmicutes bacterium]|nr:MFS transporter [Bacillota bacterium]